jgi:hypothetical protein
VAGRFRILADEHWSPEAVRGGDHWAIVRHEPRDAAVVELATEIMRAAKLPDDSPR